MYDNSNPQTPFHSEISIPGPEGSRTPVPMQFPSLRGTKRLVDRSILPAVHILLHGCIRWLAIGGNLLKLEIARLRWALSFRWSLTVGSMLTVENVMGAVFVVMAFGVPAIFL